MLCFYASFAWTVSDFNYYTGNTGSQNSKIVMSNNKHNRMAVYKWIKDINKAAYAINLA